MLVLEKYSSYTPLASFNEVFFLHTLEVSSSEMFQSLTHLILVLVKCFSYTPHASFSEVILLHCWCYF